jgi:hypothetical protein
MQTSSFFVTVEITALAPHQHHLRWKKQSLHALTVQLLSNVYPLNDGGHADEHSVLVTVGSRLYRYRQHVLSPFGGVGVGPLLIGHAYLDLYSRL